MSTHKPAAFYEQTVPAGLRPLPTLTVYLNGNVQMRGSSNIKVLVNGKPSVMMARNLTDALRQMRADSGKKGRKINNDDARR